ncbi:AbrB family transcriptional regulator [Alkalihalobacillus sp. MEB203]|uniref:AbrB family transcriptional regulator n=2 Tax=Alkalihalobacterium chitinilyticum TaxID=2980103 RepID=A0ABT5VAP1_9BACI|nr:AbrB family transcriptional regulator [Alkalihalobacterium chitinilyticum]MDE5412549.1 AbrB family transcriptional regulator [Alkalihalobacterium chitinilyticum]
MDVLQFILFIALSIIGGTIGQKLKLPVGTIIGAMFAVGFAKTFHVLTLETTLPMAFILQVMLGLMVGLTFMKLSVYQLRQLATSLVAVTFSVFFITIGSGILIATLSPFEQSVSILSAAPGGMIEMATIAKTLSLHAPVVIMLHLIRVLSVMTLFPILLDYLYRKEIQKGGSPYETLGHH